MSQLRISKNPTKKIFFFDTFIDHLSTDPELEALVTKHFMQAASFDRSLSNLFDPGGGKIPRPLSTTGYAFIDDKTANALCSQFGCVIGDIFNKIAPGYTTDADGVIQFTDDTIFKINAWKNELIKIAHDKLLNENFLIKDTILSAFGIGTKEKLLERLPTVKGLSERIKDMSQMDYERYVTDVYVCAFVSAVFMEITSLKDFDKLVKKTIKNDQYDFFMAALFTHMNINNDPARNPYKESIAACIKNIENNLLAIMQLAKEDDSCNMYHNVVALCITEFNKFFKLDDLPSTKIYIETMLHNTKSITTKIKNKKVFPLLRQIQSDLILIDTQVDMQMRAKKTSDDKTQPAEAAVNAACLSGKRT